MYKTTFQTLQENKGIGLWTRKYFPKETQKSKTTKKNNDTLYYNKISRYQNEKTKDKLGKMCNYND